MLCEKCGKNEATFYYHENVNGNEKTYRLCSSCAKELEQNGGIGKFDESKIFSEYSDPFAQMNSLLSAMFGDGGAKQLTGTKNEKKCPSCGSFFRDFAKIGKVGCPSCYEIFEEELRPTIGKVHGHTSHVGRVPSKFREKLDSKKKIAALEQEQKEAIKNENYERAAELRDEIKNLRGTL